MIVYENNKTFRNLQEQVGKNANDIEEIKQSLGNALPDPIPGPEGPEGPQGDTGPEGPRGNSIKTCGYPLPDLPSSIFLEGDLALCVTPGEHLGEIYKVVSGRWLLQCSIRGPQGVPADGGSEVVANPVASPSDTLIRLKIDGVTYDFDTGYVRCIGAPASTTLTNAERAHILSGCFINGNFLGYKNPVFFPATQSGSYYYGVIMGPYNGTAWTVIEQYQINPDNSIVLRGNYGNIELKCVEAFNGKTIPHYPNSSGDGNKYDLIYAGDGELYWHSRGNMDNVQLNYSGSTVCELYPANALTIEFDGPGGASDLNFNDFNTINMITQGSGQVNIGVEDQGGDLYVYGDTELHGGCVVGSSLTVGNDLTVDNDVNVAGGIQCDTLSVDNQTQFNNDITVNGDANVYGNIAAFDANNNLTVKIDPQNAIVYAYTGFQQYDSSAQTYKKVNELSQIVDSNGNRRFREITPVMNSISGVHWGYCAAIINGCELNVIITGTIDGGTTLGITDWGEITLPAWVYQQLQPIIPNSTYVSVNSFSAYYSDWNSEYCEIAAYKGSGTALDLYFIQTPYIARDAAFRYQVTFTLGM